MSYSLVIVESPAKCQKIQGFLGPGWKVIATMGHIRALEENLEAIGIDRDFEPRYAFQKEKGKAIAGIREAARNASTIYLASDDDREGEAISFSVAVLLGLDIAKTPRAVFHEITKQAITNAIQNPRRIDMNRVEAQQARAVLDMLVGFTISPLLWKYVGPALSAGRCQTPALRLLVDRESENNNFQAKTSMIVSGVWSFDKNFTFPAHLFDELEDEESALNYLENIHTDTKATITSTKTVPRTESAPKPLITSTLQQEASALYGIQPKSTMKSAQKLYEAGHITYMRTDSAVLSEEAVKEAQKWVLANHGKEYVGSATAKAVKKVSGAQEAHEAIRPTHFSTETLPDEDWSPADKKIYRLIWQRAVQSTMSAAKHEEHLVLFKAVADPDDFQWESIWKRTVFPGWRAIALSTVNLDKEDSDSESENTNKANQWAIATKLKEGDTLNWLSLAAEPHETRPPARYTEATLVRELEKRGIGRPSTFASLVGTVLEKEYAKKEDIQAKEITIQSHHIQVRGQWPPQVKQTKKKVGGEKQKLIPTALGKSVHDFCVEQFPNLFEYTFTKKMEERLDEIAKGSEHWKGVCRDTWASYREKLHSLKSAKGEQVKAAKERILSETMKAIQTKKGPLLMRDGKFLGWPQGVAFHDITLEQAELFGKANQQEEILGEYDGNSMLKKKGPYGWYVECGRHRVPFQIEDTLDKIIEKIKAKESTFQHTIGPYEFKKGPYGMYMYKKEASGSKKKPAFVSIPEGLDPKVLTEEAAARIYKTGLENKKKWKK